MRRPDGSTGSASVVALSLLFFLAAAAASAAILLQSVFLNDRRSLNREERRLALEKIGEEIVQALRADPTPEADSPGDPVWDAAGKPGVTGATVTLVDVSSALNLNWAQKDVFQRTALGEILAPGKSADELQQRREDRGFSSDIALEYGDLFKEDALTKYSTGYGYANINITDEFALRKLYGIRTGDLAAADVFHTRIQQLLLQKKTLRRTDVRDFLGVDFQKLFPVMNAEPVLNVHFTDPLVLTQLLSHQDLKIPAPAQAARLILEERDSSELSAEDLRRIIGVPEDNRIYQYLGVITWFWKITVTLSGSADGASGQPGGLELILARIPPADDAEAKAGMPRYLITEERYLD
jgi:hypothetical protein